MSAAILKNRHTANKAIVTAVAVHLVLVALATRFQVVLLSTAAFYSGLALYFIAGPLLWLWHRLTSRATQVEGLNDIRQVFKAGEKIDKYDPRPYFDVQKGLFIGLAGTIPQYVPWTDYRGTHMQVLGSTGFGKGVATTMYLAQSLVAGECVVIVDPKNDKFCPKVLNSIALQHKIPIFLFDLRPQAPAQLNIFQDCTAEEMEEIVNTAFDMGEKGDVTDFYRLFDRKAAQDVCRIAAKANQNPTLRDLVTASHKSQAINEEKKKGVKFQADLEELAKLDAITASVGPDLKRLLSQNALIYIIGSTTKVQTVRAQKMLLFRLLQIIRDRDLSDPRPVAMMLDELKYVLSTAALVALGTVRDKGCHIMLAHQSIADLDDCGALDPRAVRGAVVVNTNLKLIYRSSDKDERQWAAGLSGTIVIKQQSAHMSQALFHANEGQYRDAERDLITENEILAMPKQTGMFYGYGMARIVKVSTLPVGPQPSISAAIQAADVTANPQEKSKNKKSKHEQKQTTVSHVHEVGAASSAPIIGADNPTLGSAQAPEPTAPSPTVVLTPDIETAPVTADAGNGAIAPEQEHEEELP